MIHFAVSKAPVAPAMGDVPSACVKARRQPNAKRLGLYTGYITSRCPAGLGRPKDGAAHAEQMRVVENGKRLRRDRLPAAMSEDSRARGARLDLYQGHLTNGASNGRRG